MITTQFGTPVMITGGDTEKRTVNIIIGDVRGEFTVGFHYLKADGGETEITRAVVEANRRAKDESETEDRRGR